MRILVVGGGGHEHALAWKIAQSRRVSQVYVVPGNGGTAREPDIENVAIAAEDIPAPLAFAQQQSIDPTVVGSEAPLVAGIVDAFTAAGQRCFGPSTAAAQLEGSKAFTKDFLARHRWQPGCQSGTKSRDGSSPVLSSTKAGPRATRPGILRLTGSAMG